MFEKKSDFFSDTQEQQIVEAISQAELNTSGEIRMHIRRKCKMDNPLDEAIEVFETLGMNKTKHRNGVLFFFSPTEKKFAIYGDKGINDVVPKDFWVSIREHMFSLFREKQFLTAFTEGIAMCGEQLKHYFPYEKEDVNELPDEVTED